MRKKRNILEEERRKRAYVITMDIHAVSRDALAKVEQYKQIKKEIQEEILRLQPIIADLGYLFNISGIVEEREDLLSKLSALEWAVCQMKRCTQGI